MREAVGNPWTWDDGQVVARVVSREAAIERYGRSLAMFLVDYDRRWGDHLHSFRPKPGGRDFWLLVWPQSTSELADAELLHFTLGMLPEGTIVLGRRDPDDFDHLPDVLDQPVLFQGEREARSIGDRFVVVHP